MYKQTLSALLVAIATTGMVACSSTDERGPVEQTASNAGRVVDDSVLTAKVKSALIADETDSFHLRLENFIHERQ